MPDITEEQLSQLAGHYIKEYDSEEIIQMIFEAVITQDKQTLTLKWDNGACDIFQKIRLTYDNGDNFVDVLKIINLRERS